MPLTREIIFKRPAEIEFLRLVADVLVLYAAAHIAGYIRYDAPLDTTAPIHTILLYLCPALAFFTFPKSGIYGSWRGRFMPAMFRRLIAAWTLVLLAGLFFSFLIHSVGEVSRLWLFTWYITGIAFLSLSRIAIYTILRYIRRRGFNSKRVVIVGYGRTGQLMHQRAMQQGSYRYDVIGIYHEDTLNQVYPSTALIKSLDDIPDFVAANQVNEIWITLPISALPQLDKLQYLLRNSLVDIRLVPSVLELQVLSHRMVDFLGLPTFELNRPVSHGFGGMLKHLLDKLVAAVALILLSPLFAVIAVCIKYSSSGPVFFKQARLGLNGKKFMIYKFRTMKLHQENNQVTQATQNDPRITRTGQFLRRTSLDELPQFINVLRGDMSVVGPRPHALQHNEMYEELLELYMVRHRVKPGVTGWAQIHGYRGETDTVDKMEKRVEFDMYYIQNWSLLMDFRILLWSAFKGWSGKNAY